MRGYRRPRGLTPRSSGAPTAGHQARSGGTRYIFASPGLASYRCRPLSSNVRDTKAPCSPTPRQQRPRRKQPKASCSSRPRKRGDGQQQREADLRWPRKHGYGRGRLEAGQSKHTRTPPWRWSDSPPQSRRGSSQRAGTSPRLVRATRRAPAKSQHLPQTRGTATALASTLRGRQNQGHKYQGLPRSFTSAP